MRIEKKMICVAFFCWTCIQALLALPLSIGFMLAYKDSPLSMETFAWADRAYNMAHYFPPIVGVLAFKFARTAALLLIAVDIYWANFVMQVPMTNGPASLWRVLVAQIPDCVFAILLIFMSRQPKFVGVPVNG